MGVTAGVVVALPVLMEIQREAMFQMERDAIVEQQEAQQKQMQQAMQSNPLAMVASSFGGQQQE